MSSEKVVAFYDNYFGGTGWRGSMSEVSEILEEIDKYIVYPWPADGISGLEPEWYTLLNRCKALLSSHAVIDKDLAISAQEVLYIEGFDDDSELIQAEIDRLSTHKGE